MFECSDVSNNGITVLPSDAFDGLSSLTSLVFYGNKIHSLSQNVFRGLTSLQLLWAQLTIMLAHKVLLNELLIVRKPLKFKIMYTSRLLNSNKIKCVHPNTFQDLKSLNLLLVISSWVKARQSFFNNFFFIHRSLYDNRIQFLENGTFAGLTSLHTL